MPETNPNLVQFNKEDFLFRATVFVMSKDGEEIENELLLNSQNMKKFEFVSDVRYPILRGQFIYTDDGPTIFNLLSADGHTFLRIEIQKLDEYEVLNDFVHTFVIDDIETLEENANTATYTLKLSSTDKFKFENGLVYSSYGEKDRFQMIREIMKQNELDLKSNEFSDFEKFHFVSTLQYNVVESIDIIFSGIDVTRLGIFFLLFDHLEQKYNILSLNDLYSNLESAVFDWNILNYPTIEETDEYPQKQMSDSKRNNFLDVIDKHLANRGRRIHSFDYDTRKWKTNIQTHERVVKSYPKNQDPVHVKQTQKQPNLFPSGKRFDNQTIQKVNLPDTGSVKSLHKEARDFFLLSDVLEFTSAGFLERIPGQLVLALVHRDSAQEKKTGGIWFIFRVFHKFTKGIYTNTMQTCRIDERTEKWEM